MADPAAAADAQGDAGEAASTVDGAGADGGGADGGGLLAVGTAADGVAEGGEATGGASTKACSSVSSAVAAGPGVMGSAGGAAAAGS